MFCQKCGTQVQDGSRFCPKCGSAIGSQTVVVVNDDSGLGILIPRNTLALWAYYLGIFSPVCGITAIPALITGILGLRYAKQHPEARGAIHAWVGIIMGGGCILLILLMVVAGSIATLHE